MDKYAHKRMCSLNAVHAKIYDKNYKSIKGSAAKSTHTVQFGNAAHTINKYNMQHVLLKIRNAAFIINNYTMLQM